VKTIKNLIISFKIIVTFCRKWFFSAWVRR